jgi:hypothetical protein
VYILSKLMAIAEPFEAGHQAHLHRLYLVSAFYSFGQARLSLTSEVLLSEYTSSKKQVAECGAAILTCQRTWADGVSSCGSCRFVATLRAHTFAASVCQHLVAPDT